MIEISVAHPDGVISTGDVFLENQIRRTASGGFIYAREQLFCITDNFFDRAEGQQGIGAFQHDGEAGVLQEFFHILPGLREASFRSGNTISFGREGHFAFVGQPT